MDRYQGVMILKKPVANRKMWSTIIQSYDQVKRKKIKVLKVLLGVECKKIMFDTEKVRSLTCIEKNQVNGITICHISVFYK